MPRYTFEFISAYCGETDFRVWRDGRDDGRLRIRGRKVFYGDGSRALAAVTQALNAYLAAEHAAAVAKYPELTMPKFEPLET